LGNINDTITGVILSDPQIRVKLILCSDNGSFEFDTLKVKEKLCGVPITQYDVLDWVNGYVDEGIKIIFGGVLDEVIS
jgi:hypothetical protein